MKRHFDAIVREVTDSGCVIFKHTKMKPDEANRIKMRALYEFTSSEQTSNVIMYGLRFVGLWYWALIAQLFGGIYCTRDCPRQQYVQSRTMFTYPIR